MAEIILVRMSEGAIPERDLDVCRSVLTQHIGGMGETDKRAWNRFLNELLKKSERGELFTIKTWFGRNSKFHRKHMAMEQSVFQSQEKFESFEQFRNWCKIGAGFCDWVAGPKGAVVPLPRSIAYSKIDDVEFTQFHSDMLAFWRAPVAQAVLWKHLDPVRRSEMMESAIREGA